MTIKELTKLNQLLEQLQRNMDVRYMIVESEWEHDKKAVERLEQEHEEYTAKFAECVKFIKKWV